MAGFAPYCQGGESLHLLVFDVGLGFFDELVSQVLAMRVDSLAAAEQAGSL